MVLSNYYVRLLRANNVIPIEDRNWNDPSGSDCSYYYVLGFPEEHNAGRHEKGKMTYLAPAIQKLEPIDSVPETIARGHPRRFFAKVPNESTLNLKGMSGGPIFGFKEGNLDEYWILAIQSGWFKHNNIVVGCPLPAIGWMTNEAIRIIEERS